MIETRNSHLACDPFQDAEGTAVQQATTAFKGRSDKKGLMSSTVVYTDDDHDYPPGSKIWIEKKDRLWQEIVFRGRPLVLIPKDDVLLVEPVKGDSKGPCGSPYHSYFINCPYCVR